MTLVVITTICLTISLLCSIISIGLAMFTFVELKAMQKSTHSMQYIPMDPKWGSSEEEISKAVNPGKEEQPTLDPDELEENELDLRKMI